MKSEFKRGTFIAVEGMDGSGKSRVTKYILSKLTELSIKSVGSFEVGGTPIGKELRNICFKTREDEAVDPVARLMMVLAARIQHCTQVIEPNLCVGNFVVSDRYDISTMVYQGILDKQENLINSFNEHLSLNVPDAIIFLRVWAEVSLERRALRGPVDNDTYKGDLDKAKQIEKAYAKAITKWQISRKTNHIPVYFIDANRSWEVVTQQIDGVIKAIIHLRTAGDVALGLNTIHQDYLAKSNKNTT